jgi:lipopolysaccharide transport system ATP-binding protein
MSNKVISIEHLSKSYRLGTIGTGTFYGDAKRWWAKQRGKSDPYLKIGDTDHGNRAGETIWALKDINLAVQRGEVLGIIGRNGAGKSTLLKILSRVTAPTSGKVRVKGHIASLLEVGTGFHPELTGRENIYLNGAIMGMSRTEIARKFDEIVSFSEVEQFIDTPVKRYSSGMYVRLAFAVAAHLEPEILVVDEVLAVGDITFQKKCLGKMSDISKEGRTVLYVSHQMATILSLTQNCVLMQKGQIAKKGETYQVVAEYMNGITGKEGSYGKNDLSAYPRSRNLPRDLDFSEIALEDEAGITKGVFVEKENIKLIVKVRVKKPVKYFSLGMDVSTFEGVRVFSISKPKQEIDLAEGTYQICANLSPNHLRPGKYSITLATHSSILQDVVNDALIFEITHAAESVDDQFWMADNRGVTRFDYEWDDLQISHR